MSESEAATPGADALPAAPGSTPVSIPAVTLADLKARHELLIRQQQQIQTEIQSKLSSQRSGVVNQIKELMAQHGITADDLTTQKPQRAASAATNPSKDGTSKVAAKYRDPATGATWTGRGLKPLWMRSAIESGRTQDEFLIESQAA